MVNMQHDCSSFHCEIDHTRQVREERQLTEVTEAALKHRDNTKFIINMHAIHNHQIIRSALPRHLSKCLRFVDNHGDIRATASSKLRSKKQHQESRFWLIVHHSVMHYPWRNYTRTTPGQHQDNTMAAL